MFTALIEDMTQPGNKRARKPVRRRAGGIGIALAGGGPLGGMYELGVLCALEEAIEGFDATAVTRYTGVSAGAFLGAALAAGVGPRRLVRIMFGRDADVAAFDASVYASPALGDWSRRAMRLPRLAAEALWRAARHPGDAHINAAILHLARALPIGAFDNEPIQRWIADLLESRGLPDSFRALGERLTVVATDLQTGKPALFGRGQLLDAPVSVAVQASAAVPGMYLPVTLDGHKYVDGAVARTMHASVLLDDGIDLLIAINPLVPVDTRSNADAAARLSRALTDEGLPALLKQSVRTLLYSRMRVAHAGYRSRYPRSDVLTLEPRADEFAMFFADPLALENRQTVCDLAYRATRRDLYARRRSLVPMLAKHGVRLRPDILVEGAADFWDFVGLRPPNRPAPVVRHLERALERTEAKLRAS